MKRTLKKSKIVIIIILLLGSYTGLSLNKIIRYKFYESKHTFGGKDNYFFVWYYKEHGSFPQNAIQLKAFITNNKSLFTENYMAEYLMKYDFHLMEDTVKGRFIVYDDGLNYKDDKLLHISNKSNTGFFNYLL